MKNLILVAVTMSVCGALVQNPANAKAPTPIATLQKDAAPIVETAPTVWSEMDASGLQVGLRQPDSRYSVVFVYIRNAGTKSVKLNLMGLDLGQNESFRLWARPVGTKEWKTVGLKSNILVMHFGIGLTTYRVLELKPGQTVTQEWMSLPIVRKKTLPEPKFDKYRATYLDGFEAGMLDLPGRAPLTRLPPLFSNSFDLLQYEWPDSWKSAIEIKMTKLFFGDEARPSFTGDLSSGVIVTGADVFRAQTLPNLTELADVQLVRSANLTAETAKLSAEQFAEQMSSAAPMSDKEFAQQAIPAGFWYRGTFRVGDDLFRFVLGLGGVNYSFQRIMNYTRAASSACLNSSPCCRRVLTRALSLCH